jgi:hypothetical protein
MITRSEELDRGPEFGDDMHPLDELLEKLPSVDFAVLQHEFARHGRDYLMFTENNAAADAGRHKITFTHCVRADLQTRVEDAIWGKSWGNEFIDYEEWIKANEPDGYVWGTNWSLAYPGLRAIYDSPEAAAWSTRFGKPMFEITLETDRFVLRLIFHSILCEKISAQTDVVSKGVFPL